MLLNNILKARIVIIDLLYQIKDEEGIDYDEDDIFEILAEKIENK